MKILTTHLKLASVSLMMAFETSTEVQLRMMVLMMIEQLDIFLRHILCIGCYCYLVGKDAQIGCAAKDEEPEECFEEDVAAEVVAVPDDFGEDYDSFVDVEDTFAAANVAVSVVDRN